MKKLLMVAVGCIGIASSCCAAEGDADEYVWTPPLGIVRGAGNIVTSPFEIARDVSYYWNMSYSDHPLLGGVDGAVFGIVPGAVCTVARIVDGVADCLTLGIWGNVSHCDFFPTFVWQDRWQPDAAFD